MHRLCHLFFFLLDGIMSPARCPVHLRSLSELVPPGTTVPRTHTLADGPRSAEAAMTQLRHDRPTAEDQQRGETSSALEQLQSRQP